ncbi:MAG: response regulator transcription factor [Mangrovibacterium sp.]
MDKCRINIALAEPSPIVCEGLTNILLKAESHNRIFWFDNLDEIISAIPAQQINLAIINPVLIKNNIPDFIQKRNASQLAAWVGILYVLPEREVLSLFDATIHITDSPIQIADTIHQLAMSHCHCSGYQQSEKLTAREIDVLHLLALGFPNKEIAGKLNISIHTVVSHRKNLIRKTGIKSQSGLTIYAISNKIISVEKILSKNTVI